MEFGTMSVLKPVIAVAALAVGGMGAYNYTTTGCPLGSCEDKGDTSMTAAAAVTPETSCCASKQDVLETTLVADTADETCSMSCTADAELVAMKDGECEMTCEVACEVACETACEATADATLVADVTEGECSEKAGCEGKSECDGAAEASLVADVTEGECSEKAGCEGKTECDGTSDEVAQLENDSTEG